MFGGTRTEVVYLACIEVQGLWPDSIEGRVDGRSRLAPLRRTDFYGQAESIGKDNKRYKFLVTVY